MTISVDRKIRGCQNWFLAIVILSAIGCAPDLPSLGSVSGVVSMKGKPLPGVELTFSPRPAEGRIVPKSSRAITDQAGRYTLTYMAADGKTTAEGAAIGDHVVCFSDYLCIESRDNPIPYRFSVKLANTGSTPFTASVIEGEQEIDFDLTKFPNRR